jgi:uncharacterized protein involved in outer membrane biogenesis
MEPARRRALHWGWFVVAALLLTVVVLVALQRTATGVLREQVIGALGNEASIESIKVSLDRIELRGIRVKAPAGWPSAHTLSVDLLVATPQLMSVLTDTVRISELRIEGATIPIWRSPRGQWRVLPSLVKPKDAKASPSASASAARPIHIARIAFAGSTVQIFDSVVATPAHRIDVKQIDGTLDNLHLPALLEPSAIALRARAGNHATISAQGRLALANLDGQLAIKINRGALLHVEPYVLKAAETGVRRGEFDLNVEASIAKRQLSAPGRVSIRDLELKSATGGTFMGLPRDALVERLKDADGRIDIPFRIEGNLDDPAFSLGRDFKAKLALATADVLGLQALLGEFAQRSGVKEKVDQAIETVKRWFQR